jgi:hypothetical protein
MRVVPALEEGAGCSDYGPRRMRSTLMYRAKREGKNRLVIEHLLHPETGVAQRDA